MDKIVFKKVDKTLEIKNQILDMMYAYPKNYLKGFIEEAVEENFSNSGVMFALLNETPVGSLMFNNDDSEYNWLVVKRGLGLPKSEIAKKLFESFYPMVQTGVKVHFFATQRTLPLIGTNLLRVRVLNQPENFINLWA